MIIFTEVLDEKCGQCGRRLENVFDQDGNEIFRRICDTCDGDKVDQLIERSEDG